MWFARFFACERSKAKQDENAFLMKIFFLNWENKTLPLLLTYGLNNMKKKLKIYLFSEDTEKKREEIMKNRMRTEEFSKTIKSLKEAETAI